MLGSISVPSAVAHPHPARIALLGPIKVAAFRGWLDMAEDDQRWSLGLGGSPVNLLALELLKRGRRLVLISLDPAVQDEVCISGPTLSVCIGPFRPRRARDFFAGEINYIAAALAREAPDVIHAHWTYEYALGAQRYGKPHVVTAHDAPINVLKHNFIPYRIVRTLMSFPAVARATRLTAVSPYVADHLRKWMKVSSRIDVVPNGVPDFGISSTRHLSSSRPISFATVLNGWGRIKNGRTAIEAFALVKRKLPEARLLMFGEGHGPTGAAERWAAERGLSAGIEFRGEIPYRQLLQALAEQVDLLVHPALEESFCMVLAEAMALGIPVIGGQASGAVPWTLDGGQAGVLADVSRARVLSAAMLDLARDAAARTDWSARGRDHVKTSYSIGAVTDAYERIYRDLAAGASA